VLACRKRGFSRVFAYGGARSAAPLQPQRFFPSLQPFALLFGIDEDDRQLLIKLHGRLQHRAARRQDRTFYGNAHEDELAGAILDYLNKELDGVGKARLG
jgi:hypothetical protein